jgi:hypothetical protein
LALMYSTSRFAPLLTDTPGAALGPVRLLEKPTLIGSPVAGPAATVVSVLGAAVVPVDPAVVAVLGALVVGVGAAVVVVVFSPPHAMAVMATTSSKTMRPVSTYRFFIPSLPLVTRTEPFALSPAI